MATYYDEHADLTVVQEHRCLVVGDSGDALVHAAALRDAGAEVAIAAAPDAEVHALAEVHGIATGAVSSLATASDLVVLVDCDPAAVARFGADVAPALRGGAVVVVLDPALLTFGLLELPALADVVLVQPLAPASVMERELAAGRGSPVLVAVHRDLSGGGLEVALSYAKVIGGTRAGAIGTTVDAAAESALFGEYAVAGGAVDGLVLAGYDTLVARGYPRDLAYLACVHSLQRAVDRLALDGTLGSGSGSLDEYARRTGGARIVDDHVRSVLGRALDDVRAGRVADEFSADRRAGSPQLERLRSTAGRHPLTSTGRRVRRLLPWLGTAAVNARHAR